jgi:hypothetical protein
VLSVSLWFHCRSVSVTKLGIHRALNSSVFSSKMERTSIHLPCFLRNSWTTPSIFSMMANCPCGSWPPLQSWTSADSRIATRRSLCPLARRCFRVYPVEGWQHRLVNECESPGAGLQQPTSGAPCVFYVRGEVYTNVAAPGGQSIRSISVLGDPR